MKRQIIRSMLLAIGLGSLFSSPMVHRAFAQGADLDWFMIGDPLIPESFDISPLDNFYVLGDDSLFVFTKDLNSLVGISETPSTFDDLIVLSSDTLLLGNSAVVVRSIDGGETWPVVFTEGGELFASDLDGSNGGALLTEIRGSTGVGYSHDRGATWSPGVGLETSTTPHECSSFEEIRTGPFTGRLVAGCLAGMAYSDDRGANWSLSNLWDDFVYNGVSIITAQNGILYARIEDPEPGFGLWSSQDGATWTRVSTVPSSAHLVGVEGGPAPEGVFYSVGRLTGEVHRSLDAGQTWEELPTFYDGPESVRVNDAIVGPDDKLYVAVTGAGVGPQPHWGVYRTTESVIVANAPEPEPKPSEDRLVVYPNPATDYLTIETDANEVTIVDVLGRVVLRSNTPTRVNISFLPPGIYAVRSGGRSRMVTIQR